MTEINLRVGMILTMSDLQTAIHGSILEEHSVHENVCSQKTLQQITQILMPAEELHRPPKAN